MNKLEKNIQKRNARIERLKTQRDICGEYEQREKERVENAKKEFAKRELEIIKKRNEDRLRSKETVKSMFDYVKGFFDKNTVSRTEKLINDTPGTKQNLPDMTLFKNTGYSDQVDAFDLERKFSTSINNGIDNCDPKKLSHVIKHGMYRGHLLKFKTMWTTDTVFLFPVPKKIAVMTIIKPRLSNFYGKFW